MALTTDSWSLCFFQIELQNVGPFANFQRRYERKSSKKAALRSKWLLYYPLKHIIVKFAIEGMQCRFILIYVPSADQCPITQSAYDSCLLNVKFIFFKCYDFSHEMHAAFKTWKEPPSNVFFVNVYSSNSKFYEIWTVINICHRKSRESVGAKQSYQIWDSLYWNFHHCLGFGASIMILTRNLIGSLLII